MKVEIWSDVVCPWCYIGKRRFETALARFAHRDHVDVEWRSFELDPTAASASAHAPVDAHGYRDRLAAKYGTDAEGAQQMLDTMTAAAAQEGLEFRFDRAVPANTFQVHQVLHLAGDRGAQDAVKERLLQAYFTDGEPVGDTETLVRLATNAGLDREQVADALRRQTYADRVRADEQEAAGLGIRGVPFFVVDRRYGVSGAQPADQLVHVLERAWAESRPLTVLAAQDTATACGPDGCSA